MPFVKDKDYHRALVESLAAAQAENERLRSALEQAVDDFGEGHCVCEQTKQECIAALEPKP
jgi:hypothetical protein